MTVPIETIGNARVATAFVGYAVTASSEAAGFPAVNVSVLDRPRMTWRSAAIGIQSVTLDFGAAKTIQALFIDNPNFATVQIQGNATDTWTSPAFDTGALTITQDPRLARMKKLIDLTAFNYRYMRVLVPSQTPTDGAVFYQIGALAAVDVFTTLLESISYPLRWRAEAPEVVNEFPAGGAEKIRLGAGRKASAFVTITQENDQAKVQQIYDLFGDGSRLILFDARMNVEYESYLCRVVTALNESWPAFNPRDFGELELIITG